MALSVQQLLINAMDLEKDVFKLKDPVKYLSSIKRICLNESEKKFPFNHHVHDKFFENLGGENILYANIVSIGIQKAEKLIVL